jgi:hypothetical protein
MAPKKTEKKAAKRTPRLSRDAKRREGERQHNEVLDLLTNGLARLRDAKPWDERRTRVVIIVSTDHTHDALPELMGILASSPDHNACVVARALHVLDSPHAPPLIPATSH